MITLQGCPRQPEVTPALSAEERKLMPYEAGQVINFDRNGSETIFNIQRYSDVFTDKIIFSKTEVFPVVLISHSIPCLDTQNNFCGILFRDADPTQDDSPLPTFELRLPYDKDFNFITGTTPQGDVVNFLGKVQINGIDYEDVFEMVQDAKNFSYQYVGSVIQGNQNVRVWYCKAKGLLRFSCSHTVYLNPTEASEEKIEYLIRQ